MARSKQSRRKSQKSIIAETLRQSVMAQMIAAESEERENFVPTAVSNEDLPDVTTRNESISIVIEISKKVKIQRQESVNVPKVSQPAEEKKTPKEMNTPPVPTTSALPPSVTDLNTSSSSSSSTPSPIVNTNPIKKLLIFDLNKVLLYRYPESSHYVLRPHARSFVEGMAAMYDIGVWTSMKKKTVRKIINRLFKNVPLVFRWYQNRCVREQNRRYASETGFVLPVLIKDLTQVWKSYPTLYNSFNTLLLDDSPEKCIHNPPHTVVHPLPYEFTDTRTLDVHDMELQKGFTLWSYLQMIAQSQNNQMCMSRQSYHCIPRLISESEHNVLNSANIRSNVLSYFGMSPMLEQTSSQEGTNDMTASMTEVSVIEENGENADEGRIE